MLRKFDVEYRKQDLTLCSCIYIHIDTDKTKNVVGSASKNLTLAGKCIVSSLSEVS